MATVNRQGEGKTSVKGVPFTKGITTLFKFNLSKPRISAVASPAARFKPKYRVGRVKLIKRIGEF